MEQANPSAFVMVPEVFREMEERDFPRLEELARDFFHESELAGFATFSPDNLAATLRNMHDNPDLVMLVFAPDDLIQGFIAFQLESSYTVEPLALGYLFYVTPAFRRSPAGRVLQEIAVSYAKMRGACAFYNGVMAGIDGVAKSLPNLYQKLGFEPLWWGRLILKEN